MSAPEVAYARALIADMLDELASVERVTEYSYQAVTEQARLLREADNRDAADA